MPSQVITSWLRVAALLLASCLTVVAQPGDPNQGRRPERRVPLTGVGWLIAAGAFAGSVALRWMKRGRNSTPFAISLMAVAWIAGNEAVAQERASVADGDWESPSTWTDGIVPTATNSTSVLVKHTVTLSAGSEVSIDNLVVAGGRLVVAAGATLRIVDGESTDIGFADGGTLDVWGTVIGEDGITFKGMSAVNTAFHEGSAYVHRATEEGSIPVAQWHPASRFEITGISGNVSMDSAAWDQPWGTIVYNCSSQGQFVDFRGRLRTIRGDFIVQSTNGFVLRLSQGQNLDLHIGGNVIISGPSEVWFSQSGTCTVDVGGDFKFTSTSGGATYFTTTGHAYVTIGGNLVVDARPRLRMASSTASGNTDLTVRGELTILQGRIDALGTGSGIITFGGDAIQQVNVMPGDDAGFEGHINFRVAEGADVDLGTSLLTNTTGGDLIVDGTLRLGSLNGTGAIQAGPGGNVQVAGNIMFGPQSRLVYNGSGTQYLSYDRLETQVDILCPSAVVLNDVQFGGLNTGVSEFTAGTSTVSVLRDLQGDRPFDIATLVMNGLGEQVIDVSEITVHDLVIQQSSPGSIALQRPLNLRGMLTVASSGTQVFSNGNLTLISSSELPEGTASIGKLSGGSAIVGDVVVQRFIAGAPGDRYRYISSPVEDAMVADLMDDIPVTGVFEDADRGDDLPEDAPSLFFYSEEESRWMPFPTTGTSHENRFVLGRGYCFFNWNGESDSNWDVTGPVHQGPLSFEVTYTPSPDTAMQGWNLIGNPYPATIRWGQEGWESHNVSASIAVRDNLAGGFRYWDGEVGSLAGGLLALGQSFWVRTTGENPRLTITEDAKSITGGEYYRTQPPDFVELTLATRRLTDRAYFRIRKGALMELDDYDAPKMPNDSLSLAFVTADGVPVAINAVSHIECAVHIPVDVRGSGGSALTFRVRAHGALEAAVFALFDEATGRRYEFDDQGEVTVDGGTPPLSLVIDCKPKEVVVSADDHETNVERGVVAFPIPSRESLFLSGPRIHEVETVHIHSIDGRLVQRVHPVRRGGNYVEVDISELAQGFYYITLAGKNLPMKIRILKTH
ncbi:MAG: T9SS type A sorting domain-containing protein [Bacteroidota bacterium]